MVQGGTLTLSALCVFVCVVLIFSLFILFLDKSLFLVCFIPLTIEGEAMDPSLGIVRGS